LKALIRALAVSAAAPAPFAPRDTTLEEAIALALENYERIQIERETLVTAEAEVTGSKGAYDPLLDLRGGWLSSRPPVNSTFLGAPEGEKSPELAAAEAELERRRAESRFAGDGVKPILDLVVSYDRIGLAGSRNPAGATIPGLPTQVPEDLEGGLGRSFAVLGEGDFDDVRAAVVFQIPIGNRTARAAETAALSFERQAQAELARLRKQVLAEVLDASAALETAGQRIEATRAAREAAEVQLQSDQERYAVGLSTNFLVLTRQNDLSSARLAEIEALTDYRNARTEMARATGSLLEERRMEVRES
jgi:HAE1 family hydrophobic/amphiphilic exporter-1